MYNDSQDPYQPRFRLSEQWSEPDSVQPPQEELSPWDANVMPVQTWSKSSGQLPFALIRNRRQRWRNTVIILAITVSAVILATGSMMVFAFSTSTHNAQTASKTALTSSTPSTPVISKPTKPIMSMQITPAPTSTPTPVPTSTPLPVPVNKPAPTVAPVPTRPATGTTQPTVTGGFTVSLNTQTSNANVALNITIQNFANKQFFVNITDQANGNQVLHKIENTDGVGHNGANIVINGPQGVQTLPKSWVTSITDAQGNVLSTATVIVNGTQGKATF